MAPRARPARQAETAASVVREVVARAPLDDEPYTDDERAEDDAALSEPGGVSSDEVRRRLGLKK